MNNPTAGSEPVMAFIGSYSDPASPGITVCAYNAETGELTVQQQIEGLKNPTFLAIDETKRYLYSVSEFADSQGQRHGEAAAFRINEGGLSLLNKQPTVPASTCHIMLDHTKQSLIVASYHGAMIGILPIEKDGTIGTISEVHQHEGTSVLPVQNQPHPHSVFIDADNRFALTCDLGLDQIIIYRLDAANSKLIPHGHIPTQPGSGPRHFSFHPSMPYGYVINELNATITAYRYDKEQGTLEEIETVSTLPNTYEGDNACADIHISTDGQFLYGSNRGHDSIAVYRIHSADGRLELIEHVSTLGGHPRNFALSPDNRFLLVANRDGNNIVTFKRDAATGRLTPTGHELGASKPVCVKFCV